MDSSQNKQASPWDLSKGEDIEPLVSASTQHVYREKGERARPRVHGKFLWIDNEKIYIRGVTYGTFCLDEQGNERYQPDVVEQDFAQMAAAGVNTVRTYTVPPCWLLDTALKHHLRVMVGLPWEQHVAFLDDPKRARSIEERVGQGVRTCAGHPAVLCYAIGNEIPTSIVRWYGHRRLERFLERLYRAAKAADPEGLVTYVNYPSTEYLHLPFVDLVCFNVYLEAQKPFATYLAHLQNLAGNRPLILAEIGQDSTRNGEEVQAQTLDWQIRIAFATGCAGVFVFAWTDEWYRGGEAIEDWNFGLTDRKRRPKPALSTVQKAFEHVPFPPNLPSPLISVVVCSYNGQRTIRDCCEGLLKLDYPNFEVIVVDDGSTDATATIAQEYGFRVIRTENRGLSSARNVGMEAATGEIIAYLDDDARPDPHWLTYLAATFQETTHAAVGGWNIAPPEDGLLAACVANAPGGPLHVLLSDQEAEHLPGCNLAFRTARLRHIGGFDPQFRIAGDDVDICWRLLQQGWSLGFCPGAMVWHHRRNSIRAYWKQQLHYGEAEALLERKWPEKYNALGHLLWIGRLYGGNWMLVPGQKRRIYQGIWGSALFQSVYQPAPGALAWLPLMPEWYLLLFLLVPLALLSIWWTALLIVAPLLVLAVGALLIQAYRGAAQASRTGEVRSHLDHLKIQGLTSCLWLLQPLARLCGRLRYGLTPWRRRGPYGLRLPYPQQSTIWSEQWCAPTQWLQSAETILQRSGACVRRGGPFDRWDLEVRGGLMGKARLLMMVEEHGAGKQLVRFRSWPSYSAPGHILMLLLSALFVWALLSRIWLPAMLLAAGVLVLALDMLRAGATAQRTLLEMLEHLKIRDEQRERQ